MKKIKLAQIKMFMEKFCVEKYYKYCIGFILGVSFCAIKAYIFHNTNLEVISCIFGSLSA